MKVKTRLPKLPNKALTWTIPGLNVLGGSIMPVNAGKLCQVVAEVGSWRDPPNSLPGEMCLHPGSAPSSP